MEHPFGISLDVGSSLVNLTGSWRTSRPVYVDRLPPCNNACPAGENIQNWLHYAESGDYESAWRTLTLDNPLPAVMGRVCYHPCETACNRVQIDEAVGINSRKGSDQRRLSVVDVPRRAQYDLFHRFMPSCIDRLLAAFSPESNKGYLTRGVPQNSRP